MWTVLDRKYINICIDVKSWGVGIDWRQTEYTRPYYISILCIHFQFGINPYEEMYN